MELTLAILMALGIFVGIPAIIGFTIVGAYLLRGQHIQKKRRVTAMEEAVTIVKEKTKEHTTVA